MVKYWKGAAALGFFVLFCMYFYFAHPARTLAVWEPVGFADTAPVQAGFCTGTAVSAKLQLARLHVELPAPVPSHTAIYRMLLVRETAPLFMATHDPARDVYISGELHRQGTWEMNIFAFYRRVLLRPAKDAVVIDCGANMGVFSICAAHAGWHVISIEASLENVMLLHQTRTLNQERGWHWDIVHAAASDSSGMHVQLRESSEINHSNFIATLANSGSARTLRLDDLPLLQGNQSIALLKIDVEGHEARVLAGAVALICSRRVAALVVEMNLIHPADCDWKRMFRWLKRIGYEAFHDNGSPHPIANAYWEGSHLWDCRSGCNAFFVLQNPAAQTETDCLLSL